MNKINFEVLMNNPCEAGLVLKASFKRFITVFHKYLNNADFIIKPFHEIVINELESMVLKPYGQHNLIINLPVRLGKSVICKYFIAWTYAIDGRNNYIYTSYSDELVRKFSGEIKDIINSPLYARLFNVRIREDVNNKGLWQIYGGGAMRAGSVGSAITGFGCGQANDGENFGGCIILDDPLKADDARSATAKGHCVEYLTNTLMTRRNSLKTPIIIIMQRLAPDDLVGYIEKNGLDFKIIKIPVLDDNNKSIWEDRFPTADLKKLQSENPTMFSAQYMQNPVIAGGNIIHVDKLRRYTSLPDNIVYTKVFCDLAMTANTHSDYSVFLLCGYTSDRKMYIIDLWRNKWEIPQLTSFAFTLYNSFKQAKLLSYPTPRAFCIEAKVSGIGLLQEFRKHGVYVEALYPTARSVDGKDFVADKFQRCCDILGEIEAGNIYIPDKILNKVWLDEFLQELQEFSADGSHKHDDICDTVIYGIKELQRPTVYAKF